MARYLLLSPSPSYPKLHSYSPLYPIPRETTFLSSVCFRPKATTPSVVCSIQNGAVVAVGEDLPLDYGDWLPKRNPGDRRRAGVLLHPTSFRGPHGIGDLGDEAFRFVDWLHDAGFSAWQVRFLTLCLCVKRCMIKFEWKR
jgi:4-alpha-glucanotransferase